MPPGQALTRGGGGGDCLDDETLALLLEAALDASEEAVVRSHIDECDACRELFAEAARASESGLKKPSKRRIITYAQTEPGDIVARKYRVEKEIGVGGMGHVFAARHLDLDQLVALKVMRPEMLHDQDAMRRFAREGKAAAALHSEHAVRILDVGRLEGGTPFIVMEYLEGRDLASILEKGGPLPFAEAIDYVIQACDALEEAHSLGIIHRDLKPHNLFVTTGRDGEPFVKVLDFGLAKALNNNADITSSAMTGTNVMLGSPFFMSPEQVDSRKDIDHRTDLWSLGATLYHLVTGVPPFVAPNVHLVCARILTEDFPPLVRRRSDAPRELEAVLRRCMAREPSARFENVRELVTALRQVRTILSLGGVPEDVAPASAETMLSTHPLPPRLDLDDTAATIQKPAAAPSPTPASSPVADDGPTLTFAQPMAKPAPPALGTRFDTAPMPPPAPSGPRTFAAAPAVAHAAPAGGTANARIAMLFAATAIAAALAIGIAWKMRSTAPSTSEIEGIVTTASAPATAPATGTAATTATATAAATATATATAAATATATASATAATTATVASKIDEAPKAKPVAPTKSKPVRPHPPGSSEQNAYDHP